MRSRAEGSSAHSARGRTARRSKRRPWTESMKETHLQVNRPFLEPHVPPVHSKGKRLIRFRPAPGPAGMAQRGTFLHLFLNPRSAIADAIDTAPRAGGRDLKGFGAKGGGR